MHTLYQKSLRMNHLKKFMQYFILIILALLILSPLIMGIWMSLLPTADISKGALSSSHISLDNYVMAIKTTPILKYFINSTIISILTTLSQVLFCSMAAYAIVFLRFRYRKTIFTLILITTMLPFEAEIIPNFMTIKSMNLLNRYSAIVIPFMVTSFGVFMLRQSFMQIPKELKEMSDVEGLSHFQFYWKVVLPYSKISLITLGTYTFLTSWNQYLWPMITTFSDQYRPVQNGLRQLQSQESFNNWGVILASAIIVVIPTLIVLFVGQHYFKYGLNEGSVK